MKLRQITISALIILTILPVRAYEYFTIHFKDGTKSEAFYAVDIDSMRYSKISVDSIEYNEWKVQEIYTTDSIYRYSLSTIDNISFTDVDENNVANDIAEACEVITPLFSSCKNTAQLIEHIPTIKEIDGVEDAYIDGQKLFVKIKNWGYITYYYPLEDSSEDNELYALLNTSRTRQSTDNNSSDIHIQTEPLKACLVNQQTNDDGRKKYKEYLEKLKKELDFFGIPTEIVSLPKPDFFKNEIFDYDLLFIITHGSYEKNENLHWLATGDELYSYNPKTTKPGSIKLYFKTKMPLFLKSGYSPQKMGSFAISELRGEDSVTVYYTSISEKYIQSSERSFPHQGAAIIFNSACESMKGNFNLGKAFREKGAGYYAGYTEENWQGKIAGIQFFKRLLEGKSTSSSYKDLPELAKRDTIYYDKNGKLYRNPIPEGVVVNETKYPILADYPYKRLCISYPHTHPVVFSEDSVCLEGTIKHLDYSRMKNCYCSFLVSTNPDMEQASVFYANNYLYEKPERHFKIMIDRAVFQTNTPYYYCACFHDGYEDCYGEVKEFTIPEKNDNVIQTLPVEKGEIAPLPEREFFNLCNYHLRFNGKINSPSFIADYKSPTGFTMDKYELGFLISDNPNMENAENVYVYGKRGSHRYYQDLSYNEEDNSVSFAYDHNCSITENKKMYCQAYLYLIDKSGQYTEKLFGELVEYENGIRICPDDNHPHMIDLGLPSGTKWACCNVGSSAPWEDGGLYAWGESVEKEEYTQNNYSLAGLKYAENNTGVAMSFPLFDLQDSDYRKYDTASVLWGETWQMPNNDQAEELFREIDIHNPVYYYNDNYNQGGAAYNRRGEVFKGPNGNYILIPRGDHWTSTGSDQTSGTVRARNVATTFHWSRDETYYRNADEIYFGHHVRPVAK